MSDDPYKAPESRDSPTERRSPGRWHVIGPLLLLAVVFVLLVRFIRR